MHKSNVRSVINSSILKLLAERKSNEIVIDFSEFEHDSKIKLFLHNLFTLEPRAFSFTEALLIGIDPVKNIVTFYGPRKKQLTLLVNVKDTVLETIVNS